MAHKELYNMDNLENKGWNAMHNILDKEMPVEKKKRRGLIYWWIGSAAAVVILLVSMALLNRSSTDPSPMTSEATPSDILKDQATPTTELSSDNVMQEESKNDLTKVTSKLSVIKSTNEIIPSDFKSDNVSEGAQIKNSIIQSNENNSPSLITLNNPIPIISNRSESNISTQPISVSGRKQILPAPIIDIQDIGDLNLYTLKGTSSFVIPAHVETPLPVDKATFVKGDFIELEFSNSTKDVYSSYALRYNKHFEISNGLNFVLGLGYSYRPSAYKNNYIKNKNDSALSNTSTQSFDLFYSDGGLLNVALHGITVQTGIAYNLTRRLSLGIDAELTYLTVSSEKESGIVITFQEPGSLADLGFSSFRSSFRGKMGLSYQLNDRLSLSAKYNHLLNSRNENFEVFHDLYTDELNISMQYMLD